MASNTTVATTSSFPILGVLGLIFITLKLIGEITWSWWWVLAPFWVPFAIIGAVFLAGAIVILTGFLISTVARKVKKKRNTNPPKRKQGTIAK